MTDESKDWPSWRYGPDGQEAIFHKAEDVPEGWVDHPAKVGTEPEAPKAKRGRPAKAVEPEAPAEEPVEEMPDVPVEGPDEPVEPSDF